MRVLIVEDEVLLADAIHEGLRRAAIAADIIHDGFRALENLSIYDYDVVILDRDLPGLHGDEVCRRVVGLYPEVRIIMLTAARRLDEKVAGFELGADDYLSKPFDMPELVVRLRALARRNPDSRDPVMTYGGLTVNPYRHEVFRGDQFVRLTKKEFAVLALLVEARGGVVSAETMLEKAWDEHADPFTNAIRITISMIRRKLGDPPIIGTVSGVGYRILEGDHAA
ncbi:response regulator transcription factor [Microlunatus sp. GCM10028923]|uniref:response regulator transcription factor n=1 Tax=Microlunatus sp. GCM10028923 TaxID=3273400 RepID=UPI0036181934